eukprot:m.127969 g.127969  ORF g.127969 m.127969 type:complete len:112 (-) comp14722_c0_seq4:46-381(-)
MLEDCATCGEASMSNIDPLTPSGSSAMESACSLLTEKGAVGVVERSTLPMAHAENDRNSASFGGEVVPAISITNNSTQTQERDPSQPKISSFPLTASQRKIHPPLSTLERE